MRDERRIRQVAQAQVVRLDAVVDAADPHRLVAKLSRALSARDEHDRRTVGDRRQIVLAERRGVVRLLQQGLRQRRPWQPARRDSRARRAGFARRPRRSRARWPFPRGSTRRPEARRRRPGRGRGERERRDRSGGGRYPVACPGTISRSPRPGRDRCRPSGDARMPRRAPRRRPSRRGTRRPAARRRSPSTFAMKENGEPER